MPLFQRAPETLEEIEKSRPIELSPDEVAELDEDAWYDRAYRGDDAPQLTLRAVGMGALLGFLLAFTNLYIGLKIGWHLGVALSACILSYVSWSFLVRVGVARTPMTILENNCMASTASAAGYATGGTLVSAIPALLLVTNTNPPWAVIAVWVLLLAVLGTSLAIPMKRNMINRERLKFPSGVAAAALLRSLYSEGSSAARKARGLLYAALAAGSLPLFKDLDVVRAEENGKIVRHALLGGSIKMFDFLPRIAGHPASAWHIKFDYGLALIAAGALVGLRVTASMLCGALVLTLVIGPVALTSMWANKAGILVAAAKGPGTVWREVGVWFGAPMLVSAGLLSFAFQWRTIGRAFKGLAGGGNNEKGAAIEVPGSWFAIGAGASSAGIVALGAVFFAIPVHFGVLAVLLTFVLALVACRSTGETDITPTGAMGKIMQLTYGALMYRSPSAAAPLDPAAATALASANLMTAGITAGASSASADLLTDLKSGYLLGANPRRQFVAQLMGIIPGTIATVIGYMILVPNAGVLTGSPGRDPVFPAPAAQQWATVAKVFQLGFENLHPMARQGIFYGLVAGVVLTLIEQIVPKEKRRFLPSATGIGLGMFLPFYQSLGMFLGAVAAAIASRKKDSKEAEMVIPVASGMIAGESIVGVVVQAVNNFVLK